MKKKTSDYTIAQLKNINLKACANYIGAFGTEKQSGIRIERLRVCDKNIMEFLSDANIECDALDAFIASQARAASDAEKQSIYQAHVDFFDANPLLLVSLKDNAGVWQSAVILWHEKTSVTNGHIVATDEKAGYARHILVNCNMDASYGTQAENPRIKISAGINTLLNYQLFKSCERFGQLMHRDIIYINDIIDSIASGTPIDTVLNVATFQGAPIINRGYYDAPELFGRDKSASAASASAESVADIYA